MKRTNNSVQRTKCKCAPTSEFQTPVLLQHSRSGFTSDEKVSSFQALLAWLLALSFVPVQSRCAQCERRFSVNEESATIERSFNCWILGRSNINVKRVDNKNWIIKTFQSQFQSRTRSTPHTSQSDLKHYLAPVSVSHKIHTTHVTARSNTLSSLSLSLTQDPHHTRHSQIQNTSQPQSQSCTRSTPHTSQSDPKHFPAPVSVSHKIHTTHVTVRSKTLPSPSLSLAQDPHHT